MSDTKSGDDKTLSVSPKKTLTLKPAGVTQGTVRQNFSHGRTKSVVVETKKRKFSMPGDKPEPAAVVQVFKPRPAPAAPVQETPRPAPAAERSGMVLNELSVRCRERYIASWRGKAMCSGRRLLVISA